MTRNLFDQLSQPGIEAAAGLLGFDKSSAGFRNYLRELPAFDGDFTIGDVVRAYLAHLTTKFAKE